MMSNFTKHWLLSPWKITIIFCSIALLACVLFLFPIPEQEHLHPLVRQIFGWVLLICLTGSALHLGWSTVYFFLKLQNARAISQLVVSLGIWGVSILIFFQLAIEADMPSPYPQEEAPAIQKNTTLHETKDILLGPSALTLYITPSDTPVNTVQIPANLISLETHHPEILDEYLSVSPRWAYSANDDTFYSKPGHVVLVAPASSGIPGTVHAAFRTIAAGETLPEGYTVVRPGAAVSELPSTDGEDIPDIALELGGKRYLLLAWRGAHNKALALSAINTSIETIDALLEEVAETPTKEMIQQMIHEVGRIKGNTPELRLAEPHSQFGIYQAEIYANPGRAGTLIMVIRDLKSRQPLLVFSQTALFSDNPNELFRHDIPLPLHDIHGSRHMGLKAHLFPTNAPFFALKEGEAHIYFGVCAEVHFSPAGSHGEATELLLRRNYNIEAYEKPETPVSAPSPTENPLDSPTP